MRKSTEWAQIMGIVYQDKYGMITSMIPCAFWALKLRTFRFVGVGGPGTDYHPYQDRLSSFATFVMKARLATAKFPQGFGFQISQAGKHPVGTGWELDGLAEDRRFHPDTRVELPNVVELFYTDIETYGDVELRESYRTAPTPVVGLSE